MDTQAVFEKGFQDMIALAGESHFDACSRMASDLTRSAVLYDYKEGVFITEVLEHAFFHMDFLLDDYDVPQNDKKETVENVTKHLSELLSAYRNREKGRICESLEDLQFITTKFHKRCELRYTEKDQQARADK